VAASTGSSSSARSEAPWLRGRFASWVFATDHKRLGIMWLAVGGMAAVIAAVLAVFTAIQTATSEASFIGEGTYASVQTMEETLLQYFVLVPVVMGLAVYLVPLMIGARAIALPSVVSIAFWLAAFGGLAVVLSPFGAGDAPRSWWTTVPPIALNPERGSEDARLAGLTLLGIAVLLTSIAVLLTLRNLRAPGMTLKRLPLFAQSAGLYAGSCLVLAPLFLIGNGLLLLERANPGSFDWYLTDLTDEGLARGYGWLFAQGIVAVALVPALGAAAEVVATFSRRALPSRRLITLALVASSLLLVVSPGADEIAGKSWAAVLALVAAVPAAIVAVALVAAGFRNLDATPVRFALGGAMLIAVAAAATAWLAVRHDDLSGTTFTTARLGALWCGATLALLGALTYWWPKVFGRLLDARLTASSSFVTVGSALLLVGGRLVAGEQGQPSHTGITIDDAGAAGLVASVGAVGLVAGFGLFGLAIAKSVNGRRSGNDPWRADTLEWFTTSPPPPGNFGALPVVESDRPLADHRRGLEEKRAL
jgi:heme/copper-type cytochrome/quinol oxidase subunit 1